MAQAIAAVLLRDKAIVESAGIETGTGMHANRDAKRAMKERGLNISSHRSRDLEDIDIQNFDIIVSLAPKITETLKRKFGVNAEKLRELAVHDPMGQGLEAYRECAAHLESKLLNCWL